MDKRLQKLAGIVTLPIQLKRFGKGLTAVGVVYNFSQEIILMQD